MIRVYYMKLDGDCSKEQSLALYRMLPQERKQAVDRAKNEEIARKRLYTGAFLQQVLSKESGIPMEHLQYRYNEWGKPELNVEGILQNVECDVKTNNQINHMHFNLSHSGNFVVLAVSDQPVGIDIEHKTRDCLSLARRCFCQDEYQDILSAGDSGEQGKRFLEYWTGKEAYIKCVGEGLRIPLNSFRIEKGEGHSSVVKDKAMYLNTFFLEDFYCVSVCSASKDMRYQLLFF